MTIKFFREMKIPFLVVEWLCSLANIVGVAHVPELDHRSRTNGEIENLGKKLFGNRRFLIWGVIWDLERLNFGKILRK